MADIDIAGLETLRDRLKPLFHSARPQGLAFVPPVPESANKIDWAPFYRKDLDTLLAALKSRDDRVAELESEMAGVETDLRMEQRERATEAAEAESKREAVEKERDDLAQRLKRVEQGLWDIGRERDELLQALHPREPE